VHVSEGSIYRATFRVRSISKTVTLFVVSAGDSHVSSSDRPDFEFSHVKHSVDSHSVVFKRNGQQFSF